MNGCFFLQVLKQNLVGFCLKISHREQHRQKDSSIYKKQEFAICVVDSSNQLFIRVLKLKQNFQKYKVVTGKTLLFVIGPFCTYHSVCLNYLLYGNNAFSILVLLTKKRYSSFSKKDFLFQIICSKVKVLKTFKTSTNCHIRTCRFLKRRVILK